MSQFDLSIMSEWDILFIYLFTLNKLILVIHLKFVFADMKTKYVCFFVKILYIFGSKYHIILTGTRIRKIDSYIFFSVTYAIINTSTRVLP